MIARNSESNGSFPRRGISGNGQSGVKLTTVNFTKLANALDGKAKKKSNYRRIQRFFAEFSLPYDLVASLILHLLPIKSDSVVNMSVQDKGEKPWLFWDAHEVEFKMGVPSSSYQFTWDGRADDGKEMASGMYFLSMAIDGDFETHKLTLLR